MNKFVFFISLVFLGYNVPGGFTKNAATQMYYWREVIYGDLPLADDTLIGNYPYHLSYNNDVTGAEYHAQSGVMITTVARARPGVPSTLNAFCVEDYDVGTSPHLWGFPDYEKNTLRASFYNQNNGRNLRDYSASYYKYFYGNKNVQDSYRKGTYNSYYYGNKAYDFSMINMYYPSVDNICNRLYVVDTGTLHYSSSESYYVQNPAVIIFDLQPNSCQNRHFPVIRRIEIPNHLWDNPTGFTYITPDYQSKGSCDEAFLYICNVFDNSLVVYDGKHGNFWAFADESMRAIFAESSIPFENTVYYLPLGIGNVALGWPDKHGDRNAYFSPTASMVEVVVNTKVLKNGKRDEITNSSDAFWSIGYRGCNSHSYKQVFDSNTGVIFFAEQTSQRITCWNTQLPINPDTIGVVFESDTLLYVPGISIDTEGYLWFNTNHLPTIFLSQDSLDLTQINSRIYRIKISEAIKGTVCDASTYSYKTS